ncbi:frizzled-9-like [Centruroides sculpturatus]|uniref:frizzled-9-like n=1 Tax=Centruroides sculpturatus TaxID=218467 RepID=UPI000C6EDB6C|nr:frizzled-9-like [Centruroides sculpturatus]
MRLCVAILIALVWRCLARDLEIRRSKCERITIPMCQDMPYNLTRMPNVMGHTDQAEAAIQVHEFLPLVEIGCSKHLKFFLCSLYAPMCTEQVDFPIPSCQSICEEVKARCLPVLLQFNFNWPTMLNCSRLPIPEKNALCMEFPNITDERHKTRPQPIVPDKDAAKKINSLPLYPQRRPDKYRPVARPGTPTVLPGVPSIVCPDGYVLLTGKSNGCRQMCGRDVYFTRADKNFVEIWMGIWAAVCFMSTLFTICTFWIDTSRFRYPERPIIFLSMCLFVTSVAYLLRIFAGADFVSCDHTDGSRSHLITNGLDSTGCIVVFLLLYFFGMASALWWVILTLTWYLASGKKWGHEAIESRSSYFHVIAWTVPAILTIVVLTLRHVDGDELTGLCYVGNQDRDALLGFVIVPLCVFFCLGAVFIVLGFVSLVRIRNAMITGGRNIDKLQRLMIRIGVFSVLYSVPAVCVIGCHWYEYTNRPTWEAVAMVTALECQLRGDNGCTLRNSIPRQEVYIVKVFMSLLLGITTGVWIWSSKTWNSWGKFCNLRLSRKPRRDFKQTRTLYHAPGSSTKTTSYRKSISQVTRV